MRLGLNNTKLDESFTKFCPYSCSPQKDLNLVSIIWIFRFLQNFEFMRIETDVDETGLIYDMCIRITNTNSASSENGDRQSTGIWE